MGSSSIPLGAKILLGHPSTPMPVEVSGRIAKAIAMVPGIAEAHLPVCFIAGLMEKAAQVLIVVVVPDADAEEIVSAVGGNLRGVQSGEGPLEIFSLGQGSDLVEAVRRTNCGILWTEQAAPLRPSAWALPFGIPEGANVLFKLPPRPLPGYLIRCIASLIASVPGVIEGHLPQCFVPEVMKSPAQVLVLAVTAEADEREVVTAIEKGLEVFLRPDQRLEIWAMPTTSRMLEAVRKSGCRISRSTY